MIPKDQNSDESMYRQVSNLRRTKSQHLKDSRTVLRLSLSNPLKPDVKSRMKIACRRCSNYIWVMDNFIVYLGASLSFVGH